MDNISIKAKDLTGVSAPNQKAGNAISSLGALPDSFKDLIHKAGARLGTGINNILADRAGIASVQERSEPTFSANDYDYERPDDYQRIDDRGSSADRGAERDEAPRTERNDEYGREQVADSGEDSGESRADDSVESRPEDRGDVSSRNEDTPKDGGDTDSADSGAKSDSGESAGDGDEAAGDEQTAQGNDGQSGEEGKASGADAVVSQVAAGTRNADLVLSGLIESNQASVLPGQAADQAAASAQVAAQRENALEGLSTAISAVGKKGAAQGVGTGQSDSNGQGQQAKANAGQNANAQALANANANSEVQTGAKAKAATAANTANTAAQQQAADLSKVVGEGNRVSINVNVSNESATLVSKPSSTLVSNSPTNGEGGASSQNGQNPALAQGAQGVNQAASGAKQGQARQTNAQVSQAQAANAAASQAKGPAQSASLANTGAQQAQTGGAETQASSAPGTPGETTQTQQNAAAKAANPQRPNLPGQAVADQVSVQISKAVKAGADKINIHLRPASLGRVDVQLEITKDGKVAAVVIADNKDTMDLLQRDAKLLEQALQDAGLQADSESLKFSMRGENQGAEGKDDVPVRLGGEAESTEEEAQNSTLASGYDGGIITDSRVDIRA